MAPPPKTKLRVILPGGGVKGAFQLGFLREVVASGKYEIDAVYGCSIGAVLAPLLAAGHLDALLAIFHRIRSVDDILQRRALLPPWTPLPLLGAVALLKLGAYRSVKTVDEVFDAMTPAELKVAQARCHVVAYDVLNNREGWFTGADLRDGVRCSCALWMGVPPVRFKDTLWTDGGVTALFPVDYVLDHDAQAPFDGKYLFLDCDARTACANPVPQDGLTLMAIVQQGAMLRLADFELDRLRQRLGPRLDVVRPRAADDVLTGPLDANPERLALALQHGATRGQAYVQGAHDASSSSPVSLTRIVYFQ